MVARVDYDREAGRYHAGRDVPLDHLVPWRRVLEPYVEYLGGPVLDIGAGTGIWMRAFAIWLSLPVIGVEPSVGMRTTAREIGLPAGTSMTGGRAEAIPLGSGSVTTAWMSTVVHHIADLDAASAELARVIRPGGAFLIRNSFPGRHDEVMLFSYFPAAKQVADTFPTVEHLTAVFSANGFRRHDLVRVGEPAPDRLMAFRQWAESMRRSDSALSPLTAEQFANGNEGRGRRHRQRGAGQAVGTGSTGFGQALSGGDGVTQIGRRTDGGRNGRRTAATFGVVDNREAWEAEAENWVRWARTPGHDAYWYYADAFFDGIVPPPGHLTVEIGSGEGRVTRDLLARGHNVVAVDGSETLLRYAAGSDAVRRYVLADASCLPIDSGSVDAAVAYNSLMDFDDMPTAIAEVGRVLADHGAFCICLTHPILNGGEFDGDAADAPYLLRESYFGSRRFDASFTRGDLSIRFRGWSRPVQEYLAALFAAGFVIDALAEPVPGPGFDQSARWHRFPMFLHIRAIKWGASGAGPEKRRTGIPGTGSKDP